VCVGLHHGAAIERDADYYGAAVIVIPEDAAYFFCTLACAAEFARGPERFTG
jgi:hypothetical protein